MFRTLLSCVVLAAAFGVEAVAAQTAPSPAPTPHSLSCAAGYALKYHVGAVYYAAGTTQFTAAATAFSKGGSLSGTFVCVTVRLDATAAHTTLPNH